jgi:hypothetical protein
VSLYNPTLRLLLHGHMWGWGRSKYSCFLRPHSSLSNTHFALFWYMPHNIYKTIHTFFVAYMLPANKQTNALLCFHVILLPFFIDIVFMNCLFISLNIYFLVYFRDRNRFLEPVPRTLKNPIFRRVLEKGFQNRFLGTLNLLKVF